MTSVSLSIVFGPNVFRYIVYSSILYYGVYCVIRCGGELIGLRKQGYANSAFAQMIINYHSLFEIKLVSNWTHTLSLSLHNSLLN